MLRHVANEGHIPRALGHVPGRKAIIFGAVRFQAADRPPGQAPLGNRLVTTDIFYVVSV